MYAQVVLSKIVAGTVTQRYSETELEGYRNKLRISVCLTVRPLGSVQLLCMGPCYATTGVFVGFRMQNLVRLGDSNSDIDGCVGQSLRLIISVIKQVNRVSKSKSALFCWFV